MTGSTERTIRSGPGSERHSTRDELAERLLALMADDTTTGAEDRGLATLRAQLEELGAEIHEQPLAPGRTNVLATFGAPPRVLLSTHLDTVPPYLPPRREGDRVLGRGACDAKGQIVAHLEVIRRQLARGRRDLAWLGVVGEETDSIGARCALELAPRLAELVAVIDGEPTENRLATGQRGIVHMVLECEGVPAHSGRPDKGRSAVHELIDWLAALRAQPEPHDAELGPEIFNVGRIEGGEALNVFARRARAELLARTIPGTSFAARVGRSAPAHAQAKVVHETPSARFPAIEGFERALVPFGSDAPRLRALARNGRVALVGPGSIDVAHTAHEFLDLAELERGVELLDALATRLGAMP